MTNIVDMLFGCWHRNYSFPITTKPGERKSQAAHLTGTYVVCLDCGKEFPYDWTEMHVVSPAEERKMVRAASAGAGAGLDAVGTRVA
jgi:hypothetical protein